MDVMSGLLGVIERETELVRAGKLHEAMQLETQKTEHVAPLYARGRKSEELAEILSRRSRRNC